MIWIVVAVVLVGLVCFIAACTHQQTSASGLGKGAGHAGSARYKNRGSRHREKKTPAP